MSSSDDDSDASDSRFKDDDDDGALRDDDDAVGSGNTDKTSTAADPATSGPTCSKGLDLTGFLFGNIDEDGKLSEESASFLDSSTRDKLGGLSALLATTDSNVVGGDSDEDEDDLGKIIKQEAKEAAKNSQEGQEGALQDQQEKEKDEEEFDATKKDPEAKDYSAIDDALSDDSSSDDDGDEKSEGDKIVDIKDEAPVSTIAPDPVKEEGDVSSAAGAAAAVKKEDVPEVKEVEPASSSAKEEPNDDEELEKKRDEKMSLSPPSDPEVKEEPMEVDVKDEAEGRQQGEEGKDGAKEDAEKHRTDDELMPPPSSVPSASNAKSPSSSPAKTDSEEAKKTPPAGVDPAKQRRPLAAMLPEKYKDTDVRELFPEFRHGDVLRFSRLFPIKSSHKPKIWKNVRKKRIPSSSEDGDKEHQAGEGGHDKEFEWKMNYAEYPDDPSAYEENGMDRLLRPKEAEADVEDEDGNDDEGGKGGPRATDWRWGPAQYWYDMLGLPEKVKEYDYGIQERKAVDSIKDDSVKREAAPVKEEKSASSSSPDIEFPPDAFLMVTQANWEEDVIWDGDSIRHKVLQKLNSKTNAAGWVPTGFNRTAGLGGADGKGVMPGVGGGSGAGLLPKGAGVIKPLTTQLTKRPDGDDAPFYSIFPVENEELAYGRWEDEVIWDTDNMSKVLRPKMVSLDPNDDNIILGIPDDIDPSTLPSDQPVKKVKIIQKHVKKSRMLLNRSGIISVVEEESPPPPPKLDNKDPFNISNDEFYLPKAQENLIKVATGGTLLQHATPVVELRAPFVPTHIGPIKLRQFHRWPLKRFSHGPLANYTQHFGVQSLTKHVKKKAKMREQEREAAGGGEIFFMRTAEDTSAKDGDLVLFEYSEENPPLLSLVGMATKIKNYYKRKPGSDTKKNPHRYGELTVAHTSPFLGQMTPGQLIQTMENNLFRAPVYEHKMPTTDFVIIRTRNEYCIREVDGIFVAGQEAPLYEVPGPNSKRANNFARDFLQVYIYRLFWRSKDNPRRIKMDEIKRAFPAHSESSIRKRLKPCAEFHRTGHDSNWWVIKPSFRLPTEEEMRSMVTPEQCCAFFSMIAAEQRLRDAGYGEKFLLAQAEEDAADADDSLKLDDEVKTAPWNTTRAYMLAMKGKCLLQLTGPADPTGPAGEGFSYVRIPNKPVNKEEQEQQPKRTVTGTDADLRKLPLKDARAILRKNGVPEEEIKKLSRWEVIDVVRTLSTEKVKAGEDGDYKFSRGNRHSIAEHQERYREDCQRIFEVQNKVLASEEVLSTDEGESSEDDDANDLDDLDEMGKNLENLLSNKKTSMQFLREREEADRRELQKMMLHEGGDSDQQQQASKRKKDQPDGDDEGASGSAGPPKILRITRTFKNQDGKEFTRTEIVRKPLVIETYTKVRETKDEAFIRQFATLDDSAKEEMKKEKRRLQEQLRRIKRNQTKQEKEKLEGPSSLAGDLSGGLGPASVILGGAGGIPGQRTPKKQRINKNKPDLKLRCGACGATGHMRTNKACPKFVPSEFEAMGPVNVAMTEKDEEEMEKEVFEELEGGEEQLVKVDDTKISLSSKLLKHTDEVRKKTMQVKIPKKVLRAAQAAAAAGHSSAAASAAAAKRRRAGTTEHCDYLTKSTYRPAKRRRTDPVISLASFLENLHGELRVMDEALQFLQPVNPKKVPDYLEKIKNPMDLQTIRDNIQKKKYRSREDFLQDMSQIVDNSVIYNGGDDIYTKSARRLLEVVIDQFKENEDKLMKIEKAINPLLDDNSQVALTYVIREILDNRIKPLQESWPFMKPVNRKTMKHYYDLIKQPMDLETIDNKVSKHMYHSRQEFLDDIELIYSNSNTFNGPESDYTMKAMKILDVSKDALAPFDDELSKLEGEIKQVQQRMLEQAELESLGTSLGEEGVPPGLASALGQQPVKRKRGRPRKVPLTSEFVAGSEEDESLAMDPVAAAAAGAGLAEFSSLGKRKTKKSAGAMAAEASEAALEAATADESGGNLADDLRYSSDEEDEEDEDPDDADWEAVEGEGVEDEDDGSGGGGLTVTIENMEDSQVVEDGQIVDIGGMEGYYADLPADSSASALLYGGEQQQEEEQVDESYDPSAFFSSIGKGQQLEEGGEGNVVIQEAPEGMEVAATFEMPDIVGEEQPQQQQDPDQPGQEVDQELAQVHDGPAAEPQQPEQGDGASLAHSESAPPPPPLPPVESEQQQRPEEKEQPKIDVINDDLDISDDSDDEEMADLEQPATTASKQPEPSEPTPAPPAATTEEGAQPPPPPPPPPEEDDEDGLYF